MEDWLHLSNCDHKKVIKMTVFVLLITQAPSAASQRNMNLTFNDTLLGLDHIYHQWDSTLKTEGKCLKFHSKTTYSLFFVWPEDQFRYCCSINEDMSESTDDLYRLQDFLYQQHGPPLNFAMYYDLGRVDQCMPYWRCLNSEAVNTERADYVFIYQLTCEVNDLTRLYTRRFWSSAVAKYGILMSALPLIAFLEVGVLLTTFALWILRPCGFSQSSWKGIFTLWWRTIAWVKLRSWLHLTLLTVVGNCLMEAIGHQDPYTWETVIIDNFVKVYLILTLSMFIAAFVQQVVDWRVVDKCIIKAKEEGCRPDVYVMEKHLNAEFMSDDWIWQPVFLQVATLSLLGLYIRYGSENSREAFVALLLGVAAVAATWSALVAVTLFSSKLVLLSKSFGRDFLHNRPIEQQMSTGP